MLTRFPFRELLDWYTLHGRSDLPWRVFKGLSEKEIAYRVWLSEILLQQTQAPRVVGFFNRIIERFPTVEILAKTDYETFFPYYDGLGYYSRARNLLAAARVVAGEWGGIFPHGTETLRKLPWVGPYTAEAIRAFAYNIPTLSFDTNLEKIFSRYYFGNRFRKLTISEKAEILEDFIATGFSAREVNAALMDFANVVSANSKARVDFGQAGVLPGCRFVESRWVLEADKRAKAETFPTKDARIVVLLSDHAGKVWYSTDMDRTVSGEKANFRVVWDREDGYSPFILPANPDSDHRSVVKSYFSQTYTLAVSVRPAFLKKFVGDVPHVFYRARIQTGDARRFCGSAKSSSDAWLAKFTKDE